MKRWWSRLIYVQLCEWWCLQRVLADRLWEHRMRDPSPRNLVLEALLEERDHLNIQINLVEHSPRDGLRKVGSDAR
jgi:hypothetical protein